MSDQKIFFMVANVLLFSLHAVYMSWTHKHTKNNYAIIANDGLFWLGIVTSLQLICDITRM